MANECSTHTFSKQRKSGTKILLMDVCIRSIFFNCIFILSIFGISGWRALLYVLSPNSAASLYKQECSLYVTKLKILQHCLVWNIDEMADMLMLQSVYTRRLCKNYMSRNARRRNIVSFCSFIDVYLKW